MIERSGPPHPRFPTRKAVAGLSDNEEFFHPGPRYSIMMASMPAVAAVGAWALLLALPLCNAHGAIVFPPSRNAVDGQLDPWRQGVPYPVIFNSTGNSSQPTSNYPQWCPTSDSAKDDHSVPYDGVGLSGANGQACYCESCHPRSEKSKTAMSGERAQRRHWSFDTIHTEHAGWMAHLL